MIKKKIPSVISSFMVQPIKPSDVVSVKRGQIPDAVIDSFNQLIAEQYAERRAVVKQEWVLVRILSKMETTREEIFHHCWLEVDDVYREAGWKVTYDRPGYNETYEASWTFEKP